MRQLVLVILVAALFGLNACGGTESQEDLLKQAIEMQEGGDLAASIALYNKLLAVDPDDQAARLNRGIARLTQGSAEQALADFDGLLAENPTAADALLNRGAALQELDRLDAAVAAYRRLLDIQPDNIIAWSNRADIWASVEEWDRAAADYTRAIRLAPDEPELYQLRALVHERAEHQSAAKVDQALYLLTEYLWDQDSAAEARIDRAALFAELGEVDLAVRDADIAIELAPERIQFKLVRGDLLSLLGEYSEARQDFAAVIALNDPALSSQALIGRAAVYMAIGSAKEALADHQVAAAIAPDDARIAADLAWLHATHPALLDANAAQQSAQLALDTYVTQPDRYPEVGRWYFEDVLAAAMARGGQFARAAKMVEVASQNAPKNLQSALRQRADQYRNNEPFTAAN